MAMRLMLIFLVALVLGGCSSDAQYDYAPSGSTAAPGSEAARETSAPAGSGVVPARAIQRKIIYTADVTLTVERLPEAEKALMTLLQRHRGYVASTDVSGTQGASRAGTWKLRVPVSEFTAFRKELERLGELQRMHVDSQDVTDEYYDVQARISNKQVEEKRLLEHLRNSTGTLADILAVERELSRVRGEIEQLQGRVKLLANQTELTTITVSMTEVQQLIPTHGTSFGSEVARTFNESVRVMQAAGKGITLAVVALSPWLLLMLVIATPVVLVIRRFTGR